MTSRLIYAELGNQYVLPSSPVIIIDDAIRGVFDMSPLVLVDVKSGHLCNESGHSGRDQSSNNSLPP